jgi:transcription elongation factor Elf1
VSEKPLYTCGNCNSTEVQILLPAWFRPIDLEFIEVDEAADELAVWCDNCEECEHIDVNDDMGTQIFGRWS